MDETKYPAISDELIIALQKDYPDELPEFCIGDYQLGFLIGQQSIIKKLIAEKEYNEQEQQEE